MGFWTAGPFEVRPSFSCGREKKVIRGGVWFLQGFLRKIGVLTWFFGGENVVFCVVDVEFKHPLFWLLKK